MVLNWSFYSNFTAALLICLLAMCYMDCYKYFCTGSFFLSFFPSLSFSFSFFLSLKGVWKDLPSWFKSLVITPTTYTSVYRQNCSKMLWNYTGLEDHCKNSLWVLSPNFAPFDSPPCLPPLPKPLLLKLKMGPSTKHRKQSDLNWPHWFLRDYFKLLMDFRLHSLWIFPIFTNAVLTFL